MKPLGNRVHLKPLPKATRSAGGIVLLEQFNDDQKQYEVLAVGSKVKDIAPGDRVLAELYHEHAILPDGSRIADAANLLAVWRPEPA